MLETGEREKETVRERQTEREREKEGEKERGIWGHKKETENRQLRAKSRWMERRKRKTDGGVSPERLMCDGERDGGMRER